MNVRPGHLWLALFLLALVLTACTSSTEAPTPMPAVSSRAPTPVPATRTPLPTPTATQEPAPTSPAAASTATPELLSCPDWNAPPGILQFLYTSGHEVWLWDGASGTNQLISLPAQAAYPLISPDGRFIAFLEKERLVSVPDRRVAEIATWLFDRQTGQTFRAGAFATDALHQRFPEAPYIDLKRIWLPDSSGLLVQVNPFPWDVGILQHAGPLYLVDAAGGTSHLLLESGEYELVSMSPDGGQVAALDTAALAPDGSFDFEHYQQGTLHLIDTSSAETTLRIPLTLALDPWSFMPPNYAPDGAHLIVNLEGGLGVVYTETGELQMVPLENTCLAENDCWWTDYVPVFWHPDGRSFYALQSVNDFYNERAETTLSQVFLETQPVVKTLTVIHARMVSFSPDRQTITYWNQPDLDEWEQNQMLMNQVTFYLMDVQQLEPRLYQSAYLHRLSSWNPDNVRFLYFYSASGGANPKRDRLGLGSICHPPQEIPLPEDAGVQETRWLDASHFLVWTYAAQDTPSTAEPGLYLYDLAEPGSYRFLAPATDLSEELYPEPRQVVVLSSP